VRGEIVRVLGGGRTSLGRAATGSCGTGITVERRATAISFSIGNITRGGSDASVRSSHDAASGSVLGQAGIGSGRPIATDVIDVSFGADGRGRHGSRGVSIELHRGEIAIDPADDLAADAVIQHGRSRG
jgi:hypothetical protein